MVDIYKKIIEIYEKGIEAAVCTIVSTKGSTPLKESAKMIVYKNGSTFGTIGGGEVEKETIEKAVKMLQGESKKLVNFDLINTEGTSCGGKVEIYIETIKPNTKLYVFGAGHVGKALSKIVKNLGFDLTIIDDRDGIFDDWENEGFNRIISNFDDFLNQMDFDDNVFIAILSYNHDIDFQIISYCISKPWKYLGMMGSKSKVKGIVKKLLAGGVEKNLIDKVDMPIGLEINAETADEIAISISAKLILEKNRKSKS